MGPVRCAVKMRAGAVSFAEFDLPRKSSRVDLPLDHTALADALGVSEGHLGFENHVPSIWTAGVPFLLVPLHNIAAIRDMDFDANLWLRTAPLVEDAWRRPISTVAAASITRQSSTPACSPRIWAFRKTRNRFRRRRPFRRDPPFRRADGRPSSAPDRAGRGDGKTVPHPSTHGHQGQRNSPRAHRRSCGACGVGHVRDLRRTVV